MPAHSPPAANLHRYELPGGWEVLVGRSEVDNDILSLRLADPNDLWFHVKGMPGSHVILRIPPGATPDRQTIEAAAAIAAYHSKARHAGLVAVHMTRAAQVGKPKGAKPGTVTISRERTIKIRPRLPEQGGG